MNEEMFCFQCQEACGNTGCTVRGVCGKTAETANKMDRLIAELKRIALLLDDRHDAPDSELGLFMIQALFATITNANFDPARIDELIRRAESRARRLDPESLLPPVGVLSETDPDKRSLKELLLYGLKGLSAYADHAAMLGYEDSSIYAFVCRALVATVRPCTVEELTSMVLECGRTAVGAMELLDRANTATYGHPEITRVKTGVGKNPGILVSGHDLRDLRELLEDTEGLGIDIYTHSEMLPAHYYPELKKFRHLVGNYGGAWYRQDREFGPFHGPILMTTNCITPVKPEYRDRIFTTGVAGYPGVPHIADRPAGGRKDFSPLIALARKCQPPEELDNLEIVGGFAHHQVGLLADKVVEAVKSGAIRRFVVMAGCDGRQSARKYFTEVAEALPADTVILTAGCAKYRYNKLPLGDIGGIPRVLDAGQCNDSYSLALIAMKLRDAFGLDDLNKLPLSFDLAWYEQKAVAVLLALLALGFRDIRLGPTLPAFLSPGVAEVLVKNFGIKPIADPAGDVEAMLAGR